MSSVLSLPRFLIFPGSGEQRLYLKGAHKEWHMKSRV